jgi:hypothetical protein
VRIAALLAVGFILSGCGMGGSKTTTTTVTRTVTVSAVPSPRDLLRATSNVRYFGTPVSVTSSGAGKYLLVLKPQFFLVGVTANVAYAGSQGTTCEPLTCPAVPDDRWVLPAGSADLTFILPATTNGSVVTVGPPRIRNVGVTSARFAALVSGSEQLKWLEPFAEGVWVAVDGDTVKAFAEQYQP